MDQNLEAVLLMISCLLSGLQELMDALQVAQAGKEDATAELNLEQREEECSMVVLLLP
jgi:hypothetical protein